MLPVSNNSSSQPLDPSRNAGLDKTEPFNQTSLFQAIDKEDDETALRLIEQGIDIFKKEEGSQFTYLHWAAYKGRVKVAQSLVQKGLSLESIAFMPFPNNDQLPASYPKKKFLEWTALATAISAGQTEIVKWLLQAGAKPTSDSGDFDSPFHLACMNGLEKFVELFVANGFKIDQAKFMREPILHALIWSKKTAMVKKCVELGADPYISDSSGNSSLHTAVGVNAEEIGFWLLGLSQKNLEQENTLGQTPLFAVSVGHAYGLCQTLLDAGANVHHTDHKGETPLHHAALCKDLPFAKMLIAKGAKVNATDKNGNTPLHFAQNEEMVDFLLSEGAEARILNKKCYTPLRNIEKLLPNSENKLAKLRQLDGGISDLLLEFRLFGHKFALEGLAFEGCDSVTTFRVMAEALEQHLGFKELSARFRAAALSVKSVQTLKASIINKELVLLPLETSNHAVVLAIQSPYVIKGNRGLGSEKNPGFTIYKMEDPEKTFSGLCRLVETFNKRVTGSDAAAQKLFGEGKTREDLVKKNDAEALAQFNEAFEDIMSLKVVHHEEQAIQTTGRCTWLAAKMGARASFILQFLHEGKELPVALSDAKKLIKKLSYKDAACTLPVLFRVVQEPLISKKIWLSEIVFALFSKFLKKKNYALLRSLIVQMSDLIDLENWAKLEDPLFFLARDERGNNLLHLLFAKDDILLAVNELVKKGNSLISPMLFQTNAQGKTPLHILLNNRENEYSWVILNKFIKEIQNLNVSYADVDGNNVFHCVAAQNIHFETLSIFETLIAASQPSERVKALISKNRFGQTPLHLILRQPLNWDVRNVVMTLIKNCPGIEILAQQDTEGNTPLHLIAMQATHPQAKCIIDEIYFILGAAMFSVDSCKNSQGLTPVDLWNLNLQPKLSS